MRLPVVSFLVAVAGLTGSSLVWLAATGSPSGPAGVSSAAAAGDPSRTLARFERAHPAAQVVEVAGPYEGRLDLLDPRRALPSWHRHERAEAVAVFAAARCPPAPPPPPLDASLAKAYQWHLRTCREGPPFDKTTALEQPPLLHPSGRSYAALAFARERRSVDWIRRHARAFHVLELAALDPAALSAEQRALAALPADAWEALTRGEGLVLTSALLVVAEHGPLGLLRLRLHRRAVWEAFARRAAVTLTPRRSLALCSWPASQALCWQPLSLAQRHRSRLVSATVLSALLTLLSALAMGAAYLRERRRADRDRLHVLRTLTHELRTPATTLRLDIEPFRAAYDELPASCQEPLLRMSDGIERLNRVLHLSARYMALFEPGAASRPSLVKLCASLSARELLEELAQQWPAEVSLVAGPVDSPLSTDPEWLGLALRNLVENASRHGQAPVQVSWAVDREHLVIRVADRGTTAGFSLSQARLPFARGAHSPGLGLGLAIVERVARLLHGRLSHEPAPTVFQLRLPLGGPAPAAGSGPP